jgi:hypothetical protein
MKLVQGTPENQSFIEAMSHEFSLCEKSFDEFLILAGTNIQGVSDYVVLERLYTAYANFIVHLYEFYVSCFKRDFGKTDDIHYTTLDLLFTKAVEKLMNNMCFLIEHKKAPSWANDLSYYKEPVPQDLGEKFRAARNNSSHVDLRRVSGGNRLTLKEFMDKYHKFIYFLYDSARYSWSNKGKNPYELSHIKEFDLSTKTS